MMILSVDGGATKTCAILYDDERKRFVSSGIAGPSHFVSVSPDVSEKNIREAVNEALLEGDEKVLWKEVRCKILHRNVPRDKGRSYEKHRLR